jgi:CheY-specific phosphatase CheX
MTNRMPNPINNEIAGEVQTAVEQALSQMFNVKAKATSQIFDTHATTSGDISGILDLTTDVLVGSLIVSFKRKTLLNILKVLYRRDLANGEPAIADGAGEITNIIFGILKHRLAKKQVALKMSLPQVLTGDGHKIIFDNWTLNSRFTSTAGDFTVLLTRIPEEDEIELKLAA